MNASFIVLTFSDRFRLLAKDFMTADSDRIPPSINKSKENEGCCTWHSNSTCSKWHPRGSWHQKSQDTVKARHLGGHLRHPAHDLFHYLLDLFPVTRQLGFRNGEGDVSPLAVVEEGLHAAESDLLFDGSRQVVDPGEAQDDVVPKVSGEQFPVALVQLVVVGREAQVEANNEEEGDGSRGRRWEGDEPPLRAGVVLTQVEHVRRVDHLVRKTMRQSCDETGRDSSKENLGRRRVKGKETVVCFLRLVNDDGYIMAEKTCEVCRSRHGMETWER